MLECCVEASNYLRNILLTNKFNDQKGRKTERKEGFLPGADRKKPLEFYFQRKKILFFIKIRPIENEVSEIGQKKIHCASSIQENQRQTKNRGAKNGMGKRRFESQIIFFLEAQSVNYFLRRKNPVFRQDIDMVDVSDDGTNKDIPKMPELLPRRRADDCVG
jgi:hypothetical protein